MSSMDNHPGNKISVITVGWLIHSENQLTFKANFSIITSYLSCHIFLEFKKTIYDCLKSISYDIYVMDNGSSDRTAEMIQMHFSYRSM